MRMLWSQKPQQVTKTLTPQTLTQEKQSYGPLNGAFKWSSITLKVQEHPINKGPSSEKHLEALEAFTTWFWITY